METLENARKQIEEADRAIAALFCRRMEAVRAVAEFKALHGIPIPDAERERFLLERNAASVADPALRAYYVRFQTSVMEISKQYQRALLEGASDPMDGTDEKTRGRRGGGDRQEGGIL